MPRSGRAGIKQKGPAYEKRLHMFAQKNSLSNVKIAPSVLTGLSVTDELFRVIVAFL